MSATSFVGLRGAGISRVEIPIIQRDYAQGRRDTDTSRIRAAFLDVLVGAIAGGPAVHLDFVYGERCGERLLPLDGQQRLTALFLLHWYVAARTGETIEGPALSYETRQSSRYFCQELLAQKLLPIPAGWRLSDWIVDQSWYIRSWSRDPTIASMLVVLDALQERLDGIDCAAARARLVDAERPAITFDFLSVADLGLTHDLYVKMNSRGKPLTPFEGFKADLERMVESVSPSRGSDFARKLDTDWSDVFWEVCDRRGVFDDELLRYYRFVTDTRAQLGRRFDEKQDDLHRLGRLLGSKDADAEAHFDALFHAFDDLVGLDVPEWFRDRFTNSVHEAGKVALFDEVDLFRACCASYSRGFPLWKSLLLFASLEHLRQRTPDFVLRARVIRNLSFNSRGEVRPQALPELLATTSRFVASGDVADLDTFNTRRIEEEKTKHALHATHPELSATLFRLEDHPLLRGCVAAFDLDAQTLDGHATTFLEIFSHKSGLPVSEASAALLACGDYSQRHRLGRPQFGASSTETWRSLLTLETRDNPDFVRTKSVLRTLLDRAASPATEPIETRLRAVTADYLAAQETTQALDWRYYLVKYEEMRSGDSGLYVSATGAMGYDLCMLRRTQMNSWYRDPFLYALTIRSGAGAEVEDPWFTGSSHRERWLSFKRSGVAIRCVREGFAVRGPTVEAYSAAFERVRVDQGIGEDGLLPVPQLERDGELCDTADRVEIGVSLINELIAMHPS